MRNKKGGWAAIEQCRCGRTWPCGEHRVVPEAERPEAPFELVRRKRVTLPWGTIKPPK